MSKGSLFWANASGKLGESVFYRSGGEQRNRSYVKNVKNPKTEAQMRNRIQMGNWAAMYRRLKPILSKTFTNRSSNESGFNALVRANKSRLRYAVDKSMLESCDYNCIGAKVSSGTIICNIQPELIDYANLEEKGTPPKWFTQLMTLQDVEITLPLGFYGADGLYGKHIYQLLTANGNPMQLPSDFKVIVLYGTYELDDETGEYSEGGMPLSYRIYDCNTTNETEGTFVGNNSLKSKTILRAVPKSIVSQEPSESEVIIAEGLMVGGALAASDLNEDCMGMIIYYENASGKNANNAFIYGYPKAVSIAADWSEGGYVFDQILESVGFSADGALSGSGAIIKGQLEPYSIEVPEEDPEGDDTSGEEEP